jgi:hypothetical protein
MREAALHARRRADQLRHLPRRPPLSPIGRHIVAALRREGVAAVPLDALPFASNAALNGALPRVRRYLDRLDPGAPSLLEYEEGFDHCVPINPSRIATELPALFMWGLDEALLDIVESYLGLDVAYHGVCIRKEIVDGRPAGTRFWHLDGEDFDVVRVMIYLSDVLDDESGPFEYVPRHSSPSWRDFPGIEGITDDAMRRVVPEWRWRRAKGPRGTVIFGAVAKVFHHGKIPFAPRKMASFHYTSRHPLNERLCRDYSFEPGIPHLREPLTERQRACLWKYAALLPAPDDRPAPRVRDAVEVPPREAEAAPASARADAPASRADAAPAAWPLTRSELS